MSIYGEYNALGYTVLDGKTGRVLYSAGNHKYDSQQVVKPGSPEAVCVSMIRRYCAKTAREIANERQAAYSGVRRVNTDSQ